MIRKCAIWFLSTAAVVTLVLLMISCLSELRIPLWEGSPLPRLSARFGRGSVTIACYSATSLPASTPRVDWWNNYGFSSKKAYAVMSYVAHNGSADSAPFRLWEVSAPAWIMLIPLAMFAAYPTKAFVSGPMRRHFRRKRGACLLCGYSLTGNTTGICPECGERI